MLHCGLLGEKLGHSYSPQIHAELGDYEYLLYEKAPDEVEDFVRNGKWDGLNVTIPYKKTVIPFCDELSETARLIGSVNTLLRRPDGSLFGDNTDAFGFEKLLEAAGFHPEGKKALVLGTGGASATVCAVLRRHGAQVITVSRSGEVNYENLFPRHADAALVVNTTPVGMYPKNGEKPLDLAALTKPEAVLDVVYNPARTALLLQAEELGIPCAGGLRMLVGQGIRASEIFQGISIPATELERILQKLSAQMQNLILIGMPGSGKTSISGRLAERLGRRFVFENCESTLHVQANEQLLHRLLYNLISNALSAGGDLRLRLRKGPEAALLTLSDTGKGISPARLQSLFSLEQDGTGEGFALGMALCRRFVQLYGGQLMVAPTEQGTTVSLSLPLYRGGSTLRDSRRRPEPGYDLLLTELSDILPDGLFGQDEVF
jgi:shikimate dehydrogenase